MVHTKKILILLLLLVNLNSFSQIVMGEITDNDTNKLPYANVFVKNSTIGTTSNFNGNYFFNLKPGNYTLVYSYMGYVPVEKQIQLVSGQKLVLNVDLPKSDIQMHAVEIVANKRNKADEILKRVRKNKSDYKRRIKDYECTCYAKTSIEKQKIQNSDDSNKVKFDKNEDFGTYLSRESMNLIEYVSKIYFKSLNKRKERILAYHDYSMKKPINLEYTVSVGYGEHNIAPRSFENTNPYLFFENNLEFEFYKNLLDFPGLCEQPIVSPISSTSDLNYKFVFVQSFYDDTVKVDEIEVIPRNKVDALFYGFIYIDDAKSALKAVNLSINKAALTVFKNFNIVQNYTLVNDSVFLPTKTDVKYLIKNSDENILGYSTILKEDYKINNNLSSKMF